MKKVVRDPLTGKWCIVLRFTGQNTKSGRYETEEEAAAAYKVVADRYFKVVQLKKEARDKLYGGQS